MKKKYAPNLWFIPLLKHSPKEFLPLVLITILLVTILSNGKAQNTWEQKSDLGGTSWISPRSGAVGFSIGDKGYVGTGKYEGYSQNDFWEYDPDANTWTQKANFGGTAREGAVGFSLGSKGYLGTGRDGPNHKQDFWEYDPVLNTWTQKADFGGSGRAGAVGFSIGDKGYVGTGDNGSLQDDFWEYDPDNDLWTQKADFEGAPRSLATGIRIGEKGYIGTGYTFNGGLNDFWEYDPDTDNWTQKEELVGSGRAAAVGFSIGNKGYIGTGVEDYFPYYLSDFLEYDQETNIWTYNSGYINARSGAVGFSINNLGFIGMGSAQFYQNWVYYTDLVKYDPSDDTWTLSSTNPVVGVVGFSIGTKGYIGTGEDYSLGNHKAFWEYDPVSNIWTQKADFGGTARSYAVGFSINSKGYLGTGSATDGIKKDFWEYDPVSNIWTQKADFGGTVRRHAVGFSIGSKGYLGTGSDDTNNLKKDFWEYDPSLNTWTQKADFGGTARSSAVGFSIGSKGYLGTGSATDGIKKDFWEYDPALNTWAQKTNFGGTARILAVGFSIGSKGYLGTGYDGIYPDYYKKDFWEYCNSDSIIYADVDGDGYGDANSMLFSADCTTLVGYVYDSTDCDDSNATVNPAAIEICDGIDNNCDGAIDPLYTFYADSDGDGYGNNNASVTDCAPPSGYVTNNTDCNDNDTAIHPGATEICNDIDDNCNRQIDEGLLITFYADADGDLYGNANTSTLACTLPNGYVTNNTDCDDTNANVYPDAPEILFNGLDDDCDGYVDEFGTGIFSSANTASVFSLFPNPTNGEFEVYLLLQDDLNAEAKIEVINLLGQVVYAKTTAMLKGKLQETINLNDVIINGMCQVRVMVNDQVYCSQIVIEKK